MTDSDTSVDYSQVPSVVQDAPTYMARTLNRVLQIGKEIARLQEESAKLRKSLIPDFRDLSKAHESEDELLVIYDQQAVRLRAVRDPGKTSIKDITVLTCPATFVDG